MKKKKVKFNALKIAQDVLDHDRIIIWKDKKLIVKDEKIVYEYSEKESKEILNEFHDMFKIAKRCTLVCNPLRKKLERLIFICTPIS